MTPTRGILLMIASVTVFTVMAACVKAAVNIPTGQAVFFRAFFSVPAIFIWYLSHRQLREVLGTSNVWGHASRGIIGSLAMAMGFTALKLLPLPEATALRFVTPILVVIFAAIMLGERIRMVRIGAVSVGLLGVVIVMLPNFSADGSQSQLIGAGFAVASACCAAFAQIFIKRMTGTEHPSAIVFYFSLTASLLALITIPYGWVWPQGWEWALLLGAGAAGLFGQLLLTQSYKYADAGVLAPFTYISMLWSILVGFFVFNEIPGWATYAGSGLIILSGAVIVWRERQLGLRNAAEGKVRSKGMQ